MSTLGNTGTPLSGWDEPGTGYAFATEFTTPSGAGIIISDIHAYFDISSGSATGKVAVWSSGGTLLASASVGSLNVKTGGVGNSLDWWSASVTPFYVAGSTSIWIGGYTSGNLLFNSETGGSSNVKSMGGTLGSFSGSSSSGIGGAGAYVDYTPAGCYVYNGSSWVAGEAVINTGTSGSPVWTDGEVQANTGTSGSPVWTPSS